MNKTTNKKYLLISTALILVATMLMTPMANAVYVSRIISCSGVTNCNNMLGPPDGNYATFQVNGMAVVDMGTTPGAGSRPQIYAYTNIQVTTVEVYSSASATGPWTYIGYCSVYTAAGWCSCSGILPSGHQYISLYNSGPGYAYVDSIWA